MKVHDTQAPDTGQPAVSTMPTEDWRHVPDGLPLEPAGFEGMDGRKQQAIFLPDCPPDAPAQAPRCGGSISMILIALADAGCQPMQQHALLDPEDRQRCALRPALAERADWRASRFLKQQHLRRPAPERNWSLSHSKGHAALAVRTQDGPVGIDLERIRARNFVALLPQFAREAEIRWWQTQAQPAEGFYRLWTLKEALLKASGLDFPGDLRRVGLVFSRCRGEDTNRGEDPGNGHWQLHVPSSPDNRGSLRWQGISAVLNDEWLLACVWQTAGERPTLQWALHGDWRISRVMHF